MQAKPSQTIKYMNAVHISNTNAAAYPNGCCVSNGILKEIGTLANSKKIEFSSIFIILVFKKFVEFYTLTIPIGEYQ